MLRMITKRKNSINSIQHTSSHRRLGFLVAKNYYIILQIKNNISQKSIIDFCLKLILSSLLASVWSFRLKKV